GPSREVGAIFKTDPVNVNVEHRVKLRRGLEKIFPALRGCEKRTLTNAASRAAGNRDHGLGTVLGVQIDRRGVPEIFADQKTQFAELRLKGAEILSHGEKAHLVKHAIRWKIQLAVNVQNLAVRNVSSGVVVVEIARNLHKPEDAVDTPASVEQRLEPRGIGQGNGDVGHEILQDIAGQREFRKDDQIGTRRPRFLNPTQMGFDIVGKISQLGCKLSQSDGEFHSCPKSLFMSLS